MNENNEINNSTVRPYKATANLNTAIGNPCVNINDTMNINIQTMATNNQMLNSTVQTNTITTKNDNGVEQQINTFTNNNQTSQPNNNIPNKTMVLPQNKTTSNYVKKTYVSADNQKHKKKSITFSVNSEFKIALLIIVILLVFVFLLPIISEMLGGY